MLIFIAPVFIRGRWLGNRWPEFLHRAVGEMRTEKPTLFSIASVRQHSVKGGIRRRCRVYRSSEGIFTVLLRIRYRDAYILPPLAGVRDLSRICDSFSQYRRLIGADIKTC